MSERQSHIKQEQTPYVPLGESEKERLELVNRVVGEERNDTNISGAILNADKYFLQREAIGDEGADRADKESFDANAASYEEKSLKDLVNDLNSARTKHKEPMQVVDKNGNVVTRNKTVEADPTKTDDLFDTLAGRLASSNLSDDGLLASLSQLDKKLNLTDEEVSSLIDKIHESREAKSKSGDLQATKLEDVKWSNGTIKENGFAAPNPEDRKEQGQNISPWAAPNVRDRKIRTHLDDNGIPVGTFAGLAKELIKTENNKGNHKNNLIQTTRDAAKFEKNSKKNTDPFASGPSAEEAEERKRLDLNGDVITTYPRYQDMIEASADLSTPEAKNKFIKSYNQFIKAAKLDLETRQSNKEESVEAFVKSMQDINSWARNLTSENSPLGTYNSLVDAANKFAAGEIDEEAYEKARQKFIEVNTEERDKLSGDEKKKYEKDAVAVVTWADGMTKQTPNATTLVDKRDVRGGKEKKDRKWLKWLGVGMIATTGVLGAFGQDHDKNDSGVRSFVDRSGWDSGFSDDGLFKLLPGEITNADWKAIPPHGSGIEGSFINPEGKPKDDEKPGDTKEPETKPLPGEATEDPKGGKDLEKTWPWEVAQGELKGTKDEGQEVKHIQDAIDIYNAVNPDAKLELKNDGRIWIGSRMINPTEMGNLNKILLDSIKDAGL